MWFKLHITKYNNASSFTKRFYHPRMRVSNVFKIISVWAVSLSVFLSVQAGNFWTLDIETSFWYAGTSWPYLGRLSIKVKWIQGQIYLWCDTCWPLGFHTVERLWPNFIEMLDKPDDLLLLLQIGSALTKRVVKDCLHNPHQALLVSISNSTTKTQELVTLFLRTYIWHHMKNYKPWNVYFIIGRNEVVAKVIFLHLSVILFTEGGSASVHAGTPPPSRPPPRSRHTPSIDTPPGTRHPPAPDTPRRTVKWAAGYASYWNAFLFLYQI